MYRALSITLTLLLAVAQSGVTAESSGAPLQLRDRDQQRIAELVCTPIGAAGVDTLQARRQSGLEIIAEVRCLPHATNYSVPVVRLATCTGSASRWQCRLRTDALRMTLPDDSVVTVTATDLPLKAAAEAIREAAKLTIRPFYRPAVRVMREACSVARTSTSERRGTESFAIRCGETSMVLTKDCWDSGCRYFIPFAENY
ncbi:MAG TPA: hypothetical protein VNQ32_10815 [Steroidobacteraceae bacterium]|nr:hypothetical protein [Steroidobacteraceae bacterium]